MALIREGAEVNAKDQNHETPLHLSAMLGHTETCLVLIREGAEVNAKNVWGDTPLDDAKKHGKADVMALLEKFGGMSGGNTSWRMV